MRRLAAAAIAGALVGCAHEPEYWIRTHPAAEEIIIHEVSVAPWPGVQGWVVRGQAGKRCTIFIVRGADRDCVLAHERKHCDGWDHPRHRQNLACSLELLSRIRF